MSRLFLFGIGGTGARVIRSFTMMMAAGFKGADSSLEIVPIILDHDKGNGDLNRAVNVLNLYYSINRDMYPDAGNGTRVYSDSFFVPRITPLNQVGVNEGAQKNNWHVPFGEVAAHSDMQFSDYIGLATIASQNKLNPTACLIESLYNDSPSNSPEAELHLELDKGFKGNPSIGTVVFNELKSDPNFISFLNNCNPGNGDRVFIVGSIFGGTGSSGIPVIVDEIRNSRIGTVSQVPIGVALVLPYFQLQPKDPNSDEDTGAIDCTQFNAKTTAALAAYDLGGADSFNENVTDLYYVADRFMDSYEYHEGNNKQKNPAHVVEWVASTAIIDFLNNLHSGRNEPQEFGILSDKDNIKAIDLPEITNSSKVQFVDYLSSFVLAMRYYLEVVRGSRNPISETTAYYTTFTLSTNKTSGTYQKVYDFVTDSEWGFYKWLHELEHHTHALKFYRLDYSEKDRMTNLFAHKLISVRFGQNPIKDSKISSELNTITSNTTDTTARGFFKALHDVATGIFNQIKN